MSVQDQIDHLIALRAAQWYEEWRTGELRDPAELRTWLAESPRHLDVFLAIAGQDAALREAFSSGRVASAAELRQDDSIDGSNIVEIPLLRPANVSEPRTGRFTRSGKLLVAAACAGVLALSTVLWFWSAAQWTEYETPIGEQRSLRLADGSVIKLNAQSTLRVRFGRSGRELQLNGEALFKVAPDKSRPFDVRTPTTLVRAVGTQFNVYSRPDGRVTVSVLEGQVNVSSASAAQATRSMISARAGDQVEVVRTGELIKAAQPDVRAAIAWQDRKLVFKYTPLDDIATEFNRYNTLRLRVEKFPGGPLRFTGVFDADDPQEFALLLSQEPDLDVRRGADEIVISPREKPAQDAQAR